MGTKKEGKKNCFETIRRPFFFFLPFLDAPSTTDGAGFMQKNAKGPLGFGGIFARPFCT